jgi:predicted transcriptional regulator
MSNQCNESADCQNYAGYEINFCEKHILSYHRSLEKLNSLQTKLTKQDKEIERIQNIAMQLGIHHNEIVKKLEKEIEKLRKEIEV